MEPFRFLEMSHLDNAYAAAWGRGLPAAAWAWWMWIALTRWWLIARLILHLCECTRIGAVVLHWRPLGEVLIVESSCEKFGIFFCFSMRMRSKAIFTELVVVDYLLAGYGSVAYGLKLCGIGATYVGYGALGVAPYGNGIPWILDGYGVAPGWVGAAGAMKSNSMMIVVSDTRFIDR